MELDDVGPSVSMHSSKNDVIHVFMWDLGDVIQVLDIGDIIRL